MSEKNEEKLSLDLDWSKAIDLSGDGGVMKLPIQAPTISDDVMPKKGYKIRVTYEAYIVQTLKLFDTTKNHPHGYYEFEIGNSKMLKGWEIGLTTMRRGERAAIRLLTDYAYGDEVKDETIVPKGADLIFVVDVLSWEDRKTLQQSKPKHPQAPPDEDEGDRSIMKKVLKDGSGWQRPTEDTLVSIQYRCITLPQDVVNFVGRREIEDDEGDILEQHEELKVHMGELSVPSWLELCISSMAVGELARFDVERPADDEKWSWPPSDENASKDVLGLRKPDSLVPMARVYVRLTTLDAGTPPYDMTMEQKIEAATKRKECGNYFFRQKRFALARSKYRLAVAFTDRFQEWPVDERVRAAEIAVACHNNAAACALKEKDFGAALEETEKALAIDKNNVKAMYRNAVALIDLDRWDEARKALKVVISQEPNNKDARRELKRLKELEGSQNKKEGAIFKNMFDKMEQMEDEERKKRKRNK